MNLSNIQKILLEKAAVDEGFGLRRADERDWLVFGSIAAPASIRLTCGGNRYIVAIDHLSVAEELKSKWNAWSEPAPDGSWAFEVTDTGQLQSLVRDAWRLARALPTAPLDTFLDQTRSLPRSTDTERLAVQRVGQDLFRQALLDYWGGACPLTGVRHPRLLRASHMKPWAACETDAERLNVHNGLLLAAHLDAAFDAGLIGLTDDGRLLVSAAMPAADRECLFLDALPPLAGLKPDHRPFLAFHRAEVFQAPPHRLMRRG